MSQKIRIKLKSFDHEVGLLYGNDSSAEPVITSVDTMRKHKDTTRIGSGGIFKSMNSTVTMNLSCIFKFKGMNLTVSGACASGSHDALQLGKGIDAFTEGNILSSLLAKGNSQKMSPVNDFSLQYLQEWRTGFDNTFAIESRRIYSNRYVPMFARKMCRFLCANNFNLLRLAPSERDVVT